MNSNMLKYAAMMLPIVSCSTEKPVAGGNTTDEGDEPQQRPNLIVIMCDDLGYEDVSFNLYDRNASEVSTPSIDRIANEGVKFTSAYVTYSVSSPSRAGFMTGRYPQRFGYERNVAYITADPADGVPYSGLPLDELTLAESLHEVGYTSGVVGKWHLGAQEANHPLNRGFDEFFGHLGGGHQYYPKDYYVEHYLDALNESDSYKTWIMRGYDHVAPENMQTTYLTDEFSLEAVDFVERHKDSPFFLYLAYNAPHAPLQNRAGEDASNSKDKDFRARVYADMVQAVDEGIGTLLDKLEELDIDDNTLIFFLSDNGGQENAGANNGILRDGKSSIFEGGFRVPFAMRWSGHIAPAIYDKPVSSMDIFSTMSAITSSPHNKTLDGVNLLPYVTGLDRDGYPHPTIMLRKFDQNRYAIRNYNYKLVRYPTDKTDLTGAQTTTLFDVVENMGEMAGPDNTLQGSHPQKVQELEAMLSEWEKGLIEPQFKGI